MLVGEGRVSFSAGFAHMSDEELEAYVYGAKVLQPEAM